MRVSHLIWISAFQLGVIDSKLPEASCFCPNPQYWCDKHFWKCPTFDRGAGDLNRDSCFHSKNSYPLTHIPRPILEHFDVCWYQITLATFQNQVNSIKASSLFCTGASLKLWKWPLPWSMCDLLCFWQIISLGMYLCQFRQLPFKKLGILLLLSIGNRRQDIRLSTLTQFVIQWLQGLFFFNPLARIASKNHHNPCFISKSSTVIMHLRMVQSTLSGLNGLD